MTIQPIINKNDNQNLEGSGLESSLTGVDSKTNTKALELMTRSITPPKPAPFPLVNEPLVNTLSRSLERGLGAFSYKVKDLLELFHRKESIALLDISSLDRSELLEKIPLELFQSLVTNNQLNLKREGAELLHLASLHGRRDLLETLIGKHHIKADVVDKYGRTALHHAAKGGHITLMEYLIKQCGLKIDAKNNDGETPIHDAAASGQAAVISWLSALQKADFNIPAKNGRTPLHYASFNGHLKTVTALVFVCNADPTKTGIDGSRPLYGAARNGHLELVKFFMKKCKAKIDHKNGYGGTALFAAARYGHVNVIEWLVGCGADPKTKDKNGKSALHHAAFLGQLESVKFLVRACGAKPMELKDRTGRTALQQAAYAGNLEIVKFLVEECECDPNAKSNDSYTPLYEAAQRGQLDLLKYLLRVNADPRVKTDMQNSLLHAAAASGNLECVETLLRVFPEALSSKNLEKETPFHVAVSSGSLDIAKLFHRQGKEHVKQRNTFGEMMLHLAVFRERFYVMKWLVKECKADPLAEDVKGLSPLALAVKSHEKKLLYWLSTHTSVSKNDLENTLNKYGKTLSKNERDQIVMSAFDERKQLQLSKAIKTADNLQQNYSVLAKKLDRFISTIYQPDHLLNAKYRVREEFNKFDSIDVLDLPSVLKPLLKKCVEPCLLLKPKEKMGYFDKKWIRKNGEYIPGSPIFKEIRGVIRKIEDAVSKTSKKKKFSAVKQALQELHQCYQNYCNNLCQEKSEKQLEFLKTVPVKVLRINYKGEVVHGVATRQAVKEIIKGESNSEYGFHKVVNYKGVFYKLFPHAPGIEAAVDGLNNLIAGSGSAPTQLIKVIDENGKHQVLLASLAIKGVNLTDMVRTHTNLLPKVDRNNFSKMVVLSLLSNPQDGKPDNYMVRFTTDNAGEVTSWGIVGVDNDMAFAPSTLRVRIGQSEKIFALVRNVLYFFPQMKQAVDQKFRKKILSDTPEHIVCEWLICLQKKNKEYSKLLERKIFDPLEYSGSSKIFNGKNNNTPYEILTSPTNKKGLQLPIRFERDTAVIIHRRIKIIQSLIKSSSDVTHDDLFKTLEPDLYAHYAKVFKEHKGDIFRSIVSLYKLYNQELEKKNRNPVSAKSFKDHMDLDQGILSKIALSSATDADFEKNRQSTIAHVAEKWISTLDWSRYTAGVGLSYFRMIQRLKNITQIDLSNCQVLNDNNIIHMLKDFKDLESVTLRGQISLGFNGVRDLMDYYDDLEVKLIIDQCPFNLEQLKKLTKTFGKRLTISLDTSQVKFSPTELIALAQIEGSQLHLSCLRENKTPAVFNLGGRYRHPERLMDFFIMKGCTNRPLFDVILTLLKNSPQQEIGLNMRFNDGATFLHQAVIAKNTAAEKWLKEAGIDVNIVDNKNRRAENLKKT